MTHRTVLAALLIIAGSALPAHASNVRRVSGAIEISTVTLGDTPVTDAARCHFLAGGDQVFGDVIPLEQHESDGIHLFELRDGQMGMSPPPTNFDVVFYDDLGSCDPTSFELPSPARPVVHASPGDETGAVPAGARFAIVTATNGAVVSFSFMVFG